MYSHNNIHVAEETRIMRSTNDRKVRIYIYILLFLVSLLVPLVFSNGEKSHQYLVAFLFCLTSEQGSKLWLRMGGVTPNPQSQNGSL